MIELFDGRLTVSLMFVPAVLLEAVKPGPC